METSIVPEPVECVCAATSVTRLLRDKRDKRVVEVGILQEMGDGRRRMGDGRGDCEGYEGDPD
jgi:hypothetical protein